jgi:peptidoglycan-associated lipoprotein
MITSKTRAFPIALLALGLVTGCPKKTADLELDAARKALADARSKKASDCAKETYRAAESALAEADKLAKNGDVKGAKEKATEAKALADQAGAASGPGCDKKDEKSKEDKSDDENASASLNIGGGDILETIYFDYNDASIREDSKAVLTKVADSLRKAPALSLEIEGHCDVRGSTEYNLHLGERRARSVEKYLTTQGVNPKQLSIISYGEERPVDLGTTEDAHAKNRRAELHKQK